MASTRAALAATLVAAALAAGIVQAAPPVATPPVISAAAAEAHLRFLADDLVEGRGTGTRGGKLATTYIESVFRAAGLQGAFAGSFVQAVPLLACMVDADAVVRVGQGDTALTLRHGADFVVTNYSVAAGEWTGRPLFVGHAITSPEWSWDDYKLHDVRGRLLIALANEPGRDDPALFRGPALTRYGRWTTKMEEAARRGATGLLLLHTDRDAGYSWDVPKNGAVGEAFSLAEGTAPLPLQGWLTEKAGREVLRRGGLDLDDVRRRCERRDFEPVELTVEVSLKSSLRTRPISGRNIVAVLPGSDPTMRDRAVVLSAHHDHFGVGLPQAGDAIYNGAVDNGSALAILLAMAQAYGAHPGASRATLVFAAVDAEEHGLLGSEYLATNRPPAMERAVADITFEMSNVWGRTRDMVALGAEQSTLGDLLLAVLARRGLTLATDPAPEQGFFFRSDQYSFARTGIPGIWLDGGTDVVGREPGWGARTRAAYRQHDYHHPTDEVRPDWDYSGLVQIAEVASDLISAIGAAGDVTWKPGAAPVPRR